MNKPVDPTELQFEDDGPLYAAQKKVFPQSVSGTFRRIKWGLMAFCLGVYYLLPFVRWNRGLGAPDQGQDLRTGRALSDHFEVARLFERPPYAFDDQPMIVGDEHPHIPIVAGRQARVRRGAS